MVNYNFHKLQGHYLLTMSRVNLEKRFLFFCGVLLLATSLRFLLPPRVRRHPRATQCTTLTCGTAPRDLDALQKYLRCVRVSEQDLR
jgi:hypothetical protein